MMARRLDVGVEGFSLPLDVATWATAIHGVRGKGKTVTAAVMVEELLGHGLQVVVVDPTDVWWGLKSSGDGKEAGYPVPILGGTHADLPLPKESGQALADFLVDGGSSAVLSLRHLRKGAQRRLLTDFLEHLYHRKGEAEHRRPLVLVIDEASRFVPQRVGKEQARLVGAIEDIVRLGRASGFGCILIDQRPATVNKDVLTQIELLICHAVTSPQDRRALDEWIKGKDSADHRDEFLEHLASLERGEAWFWMPVYDLFERVQVRMRHTFDSSKTPEIGETPVQPQTMADLDLAELAGALEDAIEKERENDVVLLRARIEELEAELGDRGEARALAVKPLQKELEAAKEDLEAERAAAWRLFEEILRRSGEFTKALWMLINDSEVPTPEDYRRRVLEEPMPETNIEGREPEVELRPGPLETEEPYQDYAPEDDFEDAKWDILKALDRGLRLDRANLAVLSGQSPKSSAYEAHVRELRNLGLVEYPEPGMVTYTQAGAELATATWGDLNGAWTRGELLHAWRDYLPSAAYAILELLVERGRPMKRVDIAAETNQSPRSSAFEAHIRELRNLGLVDYPMAAHVEAQPMILDFEP